MDIALYSLETPHYQGSALAKASTQVFPKTYQRVVYYTADNPNFAKSVGKDFYRGPDLPLPPIQTDYPGESAAGKPGEHQYDIHQIDPTSSFNYTWQDILSNAQYGEDGA